MVGPKGKEIHADEYGRVKIRFHWDSGSRGDNNWDPNDDDHWDKNTCWVRVATFWAGKQWGAIHIPRIGQEVVVNFLEGDPDRPIIVGSVFNSDNMPPYTLPEHATQSGIKSRSSQKAGADNFNEFRFEDKKGEEEIYLHAEHTLRVNVEQNRVASIDGNDTLNVGADQAVSIQKSRSTEVELSDTLKVNQGISVTSLTNIDVTAVGTITTTAAAGSNLTVGGPTTITSGGPVTINAPMITLNSGMVQVNGVLMCTTLIFPGRCGVARLYARSGQYSLMAEFPTMPVRIPRVAAELVAELSSEEEAKRLSALAEFLHPGLDAAPQREAIAARLNDANPDARLLAVVLLGRMGAPGAQDLAGALAETQPAPVRAAAAAALAGIGTQAVAATGALCDALGSEDAALRATAALALSKIGEGAVPALTGLLGHLSVPTEAFLALAGIGQSAASTMEHLSQLAPTLSGEKKVSCHIALAGISGELDSVLPVLNQCYAEGQEALRTMLVEQLGLLQAAGASGTPLLIRALGDSDPAVRAAAALGLAQVGAPVDEALPPLIHALQDPSPDVQAHAAIALAFWRDKSTPALAALDGLSTSANAQTAATARAAMAAIRGEEKPLPML